MVNEGSSKRNRFGFLRKVLECLWRSRIKLGSAVTQWLHDHDRDPLSTEDLTRVRLAPSPWKSLGRLPATSLEQPEGGCESAPAWAAERHTPSVGTYPNLGVIGRNAARRCQPVSLHVSGFSA
jgi:hypothetical protein